MRDTGLDEQDSDFLQQGAGFEVLPQRRAERYRLSCTVSTAILRATEREGDICHVLNTMSAVAMTLTARVGEVEMTSNGKASYMNPTSCATRLPPVSFHPSPTHTQTAFAIPEPMKSVQKR